MPEKTCGLLRYRDYSHHGGMFCTTVPEGSSRQEGIGKGLSLGEGATLSDVGL
jgi:hypothetical protein